MKISNLDAFFEIDEEDFDKIKKYRWRLLSNNCISAWNENFTKEFLVHRLIMNVSDGKIKIDHIDGNRYNNKKSNLRLCSNAENNRNTSKRITNKSGYKGVSWEKRFSRWRATITFEGKQIHLGTYKDITEAAIAYDKKAKELFGEFAWLNFRNENEHHLQHC